MIAMAVVSGVLAGAMAVTGSIGSFKAGKAIKTEMATHKVLKTQKAGLEQVEELMKNGSLSKTQQAQAKRAQVFAQESILDTTNSLVSGGRKFEKIMALKPI